MLKRCPFCGTFCERSDGCNHMTCVCGESFCYVCGEKWDGVVDHYECVVDVSVRVYLFDVSDADAGGISVNTLQECLDYRRRRSAQNLWDSMKKFVRVLNGDAKAAHRAVSLYAT
ncbi:unnamed protein product, partial [Anisakis simplex]|uniref:RBR-type E3 ubiquitin transferase n=1 Tax=Anisakis simplex TaxID=6269 RepID=A0A0M3JJR1_ANISI